MHLPITASDLCTKDRLKYRILVVRGISYFYANGHEVSKLQVPDMMPAGHISSHSPADSYYSRERVHVSVTCPTGRPTAHVLIINQSNNGFQNATHQQTMNNLCFASTTKF